ncbi:MAG: DUF2784 domain-containing protein [Mycobacterium sp.]|nr:MAG: DUF2784 domain-containing protein [Mycobacterium sp.]
MVAAAHFAFLIYLPSGGFLALALRSAGRRSWRRALALHVAVAAWAFGSVTLHLGCPLTDWERWARRHAGMAPLDSAGFIEHYIIGVLYPAEAAGVAQFCALTAVAVSWVLLAVTRGRPRPPSLAPRTRDRRPPSGSDIMPEWASRHRSG